ncbi:MAG: MarR family winged helix-turn-helix transcriptional regulator [Propionibacteriaceae bacterium]|nr:MarR family winged helix-turn-helix transcriptional regulator [Propionibacteriaceae bacterium]
MPGAPYHPAALALQGVIGLSNEIERELARLLGVNLTDYRALSSLASSGEVPVGRLAAALGATPAATTAIVDRLEVKGLAQRRRAEEDRRQVRVAVTPAAIGRIIELMVPLMRRVDDHVVGLSEAEQRVVAEFVVVLRDALGDHLADLVAQEKSDQAGPGQKGTHDE